MPPSTVASQRITPFLWFDTQAEEAMNFYVSLFEDSEILSTSPGPDGRIMTGTFRLAGLDLMALNGGPQFPFTEAISLFVSCETQSEVDRLWDALLADGGEPSRCGWLKDRFGLSWQIIPDDLGRLLGDPDRERAGRVMQAMLGMSKIEVSGLRAAYNDA
ncbi:MAG: VOC family protein [Dehalococcoidia bacterium]|nr:VOC family protein [Dehalococcoidia bacterium]